MVFFYFCSYLLILADAAATDICLVLLLCAFFYIGVATTVKHCLSQDLFVMKMEMKTMKRKRISPNEMRSFFFAGILISKYINFSSSYSLLLFLFFFHFNWHILFSCNK